MAKITIRGDRSYRLTTTEELTVFVLLRTSGLSSPLIDAGFKNVLKFES